MKTDFKPYDKVLVRNNENEPWTATFFSHWTEDYNSYLAVNCNGLAYRHCISFRIKWKLFIWMMLKLQK